MLPLDGALVVTGPFVTGGALVGASVFGVGGKVTVIRYENQNFISSIKCVKKHHENAWVHRFGWP